MALHDDVCWAQLNGWLGVEDSSPAEDADECRLLRERSVAGKSNVIPSCAVHGDGFSYEPWPGANEAARSQHAFEAMSGDGSLCAHCGLYEDATCHRVGDSVTEPVVDSGS